MLSLVASGELNDFSDTSSLRQRVADAAGVDTSLVTITVAAASVRITAIIVVPASTTVSALQASLSTSLGTAAAATTQLGIAVEAVPIIEIASPPPPPPPPLPPLPPPTQLSPNASSSSSGFPVAGVVGGSAGGVLVLLGFAMCLRRQRQQRAGIPKVIARKGACNEPGAWHFMISYTQRSDRAVALATKLEKDLADRGYSIWLDVNMSDKSEAAMKEAVEQSMVVIAVITGGTPKLDDDNAYLKRPFCLSELRWAFDAKKHVQPLVSMEDKDNISAFIQMAPVDLQRIGSIDFIDLNMKDKEFWRVGVDRILQKAKVAGAFARIPAKAVIRPPVRV